MDIKIPFFVTITGMILGVFIATVFGINEHLFKDRIAHQLEQNTKIQSISDPAARSAKIAKEKTKNWRYFQRFHFHSTGIGSMAMGILLFLALCSAAPRKMRNVAAYMVSVGGFLYPFIWLFAAVFGPEIGRSAAKEKFAVFGYMGGVFLLGLIFTLFLSVRYPWSVAEAK